MKSNLKMAFLLSASLFFQAKAQDNLRLNQLQVIGSHNSYKMAIEPQLFDFLQSKDPSNGMKSLQYEHISITDQLNLGLRNLEIDVYADTKGGQYAHPKGLDLVQSNIPYDPEGKMKQPGFKVFHVLDIDFRSSTLTFQDCLKEIKNWSDAHPGHTPIFITLEPKDGETNRFGTTPEPFTPALFDAVDEEIKKGLGADKLITPDMVRGKYKTLEEAVLKNNWPTLEKAKGRVLFVLDDSKKKKEMYMQDHPSLKDRIVFVNAEPGTPEAAVLFRNDPEDATISDLVKKGYIIRTRADNSTEQARNNDYRHFELAQKSGAQIISTDYYQPSALFESTYKVQFEDGKYEKINPVNGKKK
ncbi:hypothetical protein J2X31_002338 [Flavobacterium arsenatis]|uniref:Calcium-dependent phosphoinositide phospholipase C n=1 Tax=Flavobacterium arsenatis TaxID=1484332 RepID=A0ABU1TR01_9FLAO|nr:phosphatidylinositol-specific phospholipase C1-like protein [Flavobacterium arsenatis]MDR6968321.1 hypothetical protein [Flavobacterium arsenatis]